MSHFGKPRPFGRTNMGNNSNTNNTPQPPQPQQIQQPQTPQPAGFVRPSYLPSDEQVALKVLDEEANAGFDARGTLGGQHGGSGNQQGGFSAPSGNMPAYPRSEPAAGMGHPGAARTARDAAITRRLQEEHDAKIARQLQEEEETHSASLGGFAGFVSSSHSPSSAGPSRAGPSSEMSYGAGGFDSGPSGTSGGFTTSTSFDNDDDFGVPGPSGAASGFHHPGMQRVILVAATGPPRRLPLLLSIIPHLVFHETGLPEGSEDGSWGTYNGEQQPWGSPLGVAFSSEPLGDIPGLVIRQVFSGGQLWYKFVIDPRW